MTDPRVMDDPLRRLDAAVARVAASTAGRTPTGLTHDDADDTLGTVATDDAVGFDPRALLRAVARHRAPAVVIGQVAGILHGSQDLTGDLDLLWDGSLAHAEVMADAFAEVGAELADDNGHPVACDIHAFGLPKVQFRTASASGDCCTVRLNWGGLAVADFLARAETARSPDDPEATVRYLRRDDLIAMRLAAGRPKDLRRAVELERLARLAAADDGIAPGVTVSADRS